MIRYYLTTLGAHFRSGRSLYLLTVFGVALGVASVLCIQIINRNALAAFAGSLKAVSGEADLTIRARTPTLPEATLADVLATEGVGAAWPLYRTSVAVTGRDGLLLDVIGFDVLAPVSLPEAAGAADPAAALATPGWVAVTPSLASELGWAVGDSLHVTAGARRATLTIGALVDFQRVSPLASRKLAVMDIAQAQSLFGRRGDIHQIDVRARDGVELDRLSTRLGARLGSAFQVLTPEQRETEAADLMGAFRLNLTALSLISLFVGIFLVHSSTQASLVRRRAEFGVLRCLGATRGQLLAVILGEVLLLGTLGVAAGLPLGYWAAAANVEVVSETLTNLYLLREIETLELAPWIYLLAGVVGVGGAVGGALGPALDVSRRDTKALLAPFTLHEKVRSLAGGLFAAGVLVLACAAGWYLTIGVAWRHGGFVLAIALLVALPLLTPLVVRVITGRVTVTAFNWRYGLKSLGARLQTTSFAVAALSIAVSMLVGITLMIGSFRRTVEVWIGTSVRADVYISTPSWRGAGTDGTLPDGLVTQVRSTPGVARVDRLRSFMGYAGDRRILVAGVDFGLPGGQERFPLMGGDRTAAFDSVRAGSALISEPLARKTGLGVGDAILIAGAGTAPFRIAGVYYDYSTEAGAVAMDLAVLHERFRLDGVNSIALYLEPGEEPEAMVDDLRARFTGYPLTIRSNRRLREQALQVFDQTFAITRILQAISLVIAASGITLTLLVLARERLSELALYRALGARRRQIFRVFVSQGVGMSILGMGIGSAGGLTLAAILIFVINRAYFGWTIQVHVPWIAVAGQAATILAVATVASVYPALCASRTPATELRRDDL